MAFQVVRTPRFDRELAEISGSLAIGDEIMKALEWQLTRNPQLAGTHEGDNLWCAQGSSYLMGRTLVYYTIEPNEVILLSIHRFGDTST